jgi:hypothetical protein
MFLLTTLAGLVLYGLFVFSSGFERALWQNYTQGMRLHALNHQAADAKTVSAPFIQPEIRQVEGINFEEAQKYAITHPIAVYSENGNFFVVYWKLMHKKISMAWLNALSVLSVTGLLGIFYFRYKKRKPQLLQVLIFAFTLYMTVEIFIPIYRHQYNVVQWFPLVLVALLFSGNRSNLIMLLLALGLFLNIVNMTWIPMRHTLGEFAWFAAMLLISFSPGEKLNVSAKQSLPFPLPTQ